MQQKLYDALMVSQKLLIESGCELEIVEKNAKIISDARTFLILEKISAFRRFIERDLALDGSGGTIFNREDADICLSRLNEIENLLVFT